MDQNVQKDVLEVGKKLVDLCKRGEAMKAIDTLYANNIQSEEAMSSAEMPSHLEGIDAVRKVNREWDERMDVHSMDVAGPFPLGDRFAVHYKYDATDRTSKQRMKMEEVALYTVKGGKIIKQEFFYTM